MEVKRSDLFCVPANQPLTKLTLTRIYLSNLSVCFFIQSTLSPASGRSAVRWTRFQLVEVVPLYVGLGHGLDPPEVLAAGLRIEDAHPALWCAVIG